MKRFSFVVAAVIISSTLHAQDRDSTVRSLDEIVITANKYPKKQSETSKVITVINSLQIEKSGGKTLPELLNTVAGVTIIGANNNPGTNLTTSIRGSSAGNVLILMDGIPVNDPSVNTNYFDLNFIDLSQVERIEILKGGHSTLYGSDAVAGVINIIRKKPGIAKLSTHGSLSAGSYNTFQQALGIGGMVKKIDYSVNYSHISSNGFSSAHDRDNSGIFDDDGYDQHSVNGRVGIKPAKNLKVTLSGSMSKYKTDLDASGFTDERDYTADNNNRQAAAGLVYSYGKGNITVNYHFNRAERKYLDDSIHKSSLFLDFSRSRFIGRTHFAEIYTNWKFKELELLAGLDYRKNDTEQEYWSTGPYGPYGTNLNAKMNQVSPYASVVFKPFTNFTAEAGARLNLHSEYGNNCTFTLNPAIVLKNKVKLFTNLYTAFKTPTLYQLFDQMAGNKNLHPEKSLILEGGAELFSGKLFTSRIVAFYRNTKDAIVYSFNPVTFESKYLNAARQQNHGIELEMGYTKEKLTLSVNYTYTDGKTMASFDGIGAPLTKDTTYYNLYRIPKHAVNIHARLQLSDKFHVAARVHGVSSREEFIYGSSPESLKAYTLVDLYGEYKFTNKLRIFLDLKNIFDKEYFDFLGYNAKKFNFMGGVNFRL